eukprot:410185-Pyramimonas_sp.AAC.1
MTLDAAGQVTAIPAQSASDRTIHLARDPAKSQLQPPSPNQNIEAQQVAAQDADDWPQALGEKVGNQTANITKA